MSACVSAAGGINTASGGDGDDVLIGGNRAGNAYESFRGLDGADRINGGSGFDRADYARDYTTVGAGGFEGTRGIIADCRQRVDQ